MPDTIVNCKDVTTTESRNRVVYKIPCRHYGGTSYVGQTGRSLVMRLREHLRSVFIGEKNTSPLAEHVLDT